MSPADKFSIPAEDEASLWAARLDGGELSESDRADLEGWLAGDPGRRELLDNFRRLSAGLDRLLPALAAQGRVEMPAQRAPARPSWRPSWITAGAFAVAAVVAGTVWIEWSGRPERMTAPVAQRRSFTLSDGTRVELNANTSISVKSSRGERRVGLADGEAYFEVTKDRSRPFIVETPMGSVRVTGTQFNVRELGKSELVVTVVEGSVQVRSDDSAAAHAAGPVALGAGDRLVADETGVTVTALPKASLDDALAWRDGWIVFRGTPLSKALAELTRYYGRTIAVTDSAAGVKLNTRFHLEDDLDGVLASLEVSLPEVRVEREADGGAKVSLRAER
jgi:transmembrane sensor